MSNETSVLSSPNRLIHDRERLSYVTRLLGSPPGVHTALLGTIVFLVNAGEILHSASGWWATLADLARLALLVGVLRIYAADRIPEYYKQRFGSVQAARKRGSKWSAIFFLALLGLLLIAQYFDPVASRLYLMISDPARQINLWPSVFWVVLLCSSLRWHMSSIERQRLYFILLGMVGFASIVSYAIWHPDAKQLGLWKLLNAGGLGLSLMALGLYDSIVLVRPLPKRVAEGEDE